MTLSGDGYSLLWNQGDTDFRKHWQATQCRCFVPCLVGIHDQACTTFQRGGKAPHARHVCFGSLGPNLNLEGIPGSRQNPKILGRDNAEIVRYFITIGAPFSGHLLA